MAKTKTNTKTTTTPANIRAKFGFLNYDDMILRIAEGKLDAYDIVFSKDQKQVFIINDKLEPIAMHSKVYVYESVEKANETLNINTDTYEGQIVSILNGDVYYGYIVNKNELGAYYVKPLYEQERIDYDTLGNKPIENKIGTYNNPIILSELPTGMYNICGKYKVTNEDEKEYLTGERRLVLVNNMDTTSTIKVVTADGIMDFIVSNGEVLLDKVITLNYLNEHGYTTETYVNERIKELDYVSKKEINTYIENYISSVLNTMIDERLDVVLDQKIENKLQTMAISEDEICSLFDDNDNGILDFLE